MLKDRIQEDIKSAMRARDKARVGALRMVSAEIKQREVDERKELDDQDVLAVLGKMAKQRKDALEQFRKAGRTDLVEQESYELDLIDSYLPAPLSSDELGALIEHTLVETGAGSMRDMGKVMGALRPQLQGRADMAAVSAAVKAKLSG